MIDLMFNKYVFVITGMSYIVDSSGTSKSVKAHQNIFNKKGIGFISIFPITKTIQKGLHKYEYISGCYALIVDGSFIKVCTSYEIICFLKNLQEKDINCIGILIHHLIRNRTEDIIDIVKSIQNVPIVFYIHDFFTCCVCPQLIKNFIETCSDNYKNCDGCYFQKDNIKHLSKINDLFKSIESRTTFVAPANYTLDRWLKFYPQYKSKSLVIGHLKQNGIYNGNSRVLEKTDKIKIAFVGAQKEIKGWDKFKKLVIELREKSDDYCFYYFGNGRERIDGVISVFVDSNSQGELAMTEALRKYCIDVVLFVCVWGETYSYTMYEAHAANCYLIGRETGGNIPDKISRSQWGDTYKDENTLLGYLINSFELRNRINDFRNRFSGSIPYVYEDNDEIVNIFTDENYAFIKTETKKSNIYETIKARVLNTVFIKKRLDL